MKDKCILLFLSLLSISLCVGQGGGACPGNPFDVTSVSYSCAEISYGSHPKQKYDFYVPEGNSPKPVVIFIHGGGFVSGDKDNIKKPSIKDDARFFLENGCILVSINYRLVRTNNETVGIKKCIQDCKDAIAHIRNLPSSYGIDPDRIALWGSSAGAGISMLIGFNDDAIGNPIKAIWVDKPQATYDINKWHGSTGVFPDCSLTNIIAILTKNKVKAIYGKGNIAGFSQNYLLNNPAMITYRDEVDILKYIESTDPPVWIQNITAPNNSNIANNTLLSTCPCYTCAEVLNHHINHADKLKYELNLKGVEWHLTKDSGYTHSGTAQGSEKEFIFDKIQ